MQDPGWLHCLRIDSSVGATPYRGAQEKEAVDSDRETAAWKLVLLVAEVSLLCFLCACTVLRHTYSRSASRDPGSP